MRFVVLRCRPVPVIDQRGHGPHMEPVTEEVIGPFDSEAAASTFAGRAPFARQRGVLRIAPVSDPDGWTMPTWCPACRAPSPEDVLGCRSCDTAFCDACGSPAEGLCGFCGGAS